MDSNKKKLNLKINDKMYHWHDQYITGKQVKELGEIPLNNLLFLEIKKSWEDELIEDETRVNLARPSIERFYSKEKDDQLPFLIIVNAQEKEWGSRVISYKDVVKLAFPDYTGAANVVYTVNYTNGPGQNPKGSMVKGDSVFVKNKMKFHVTPTNQS